MENERFPATCVENKACRLPPVGRKIESIWANLQKQII